MKVTLSFVFALLGCCVYLAESQDQMNTVEVLFIFDKQAIIKYTGPQFGYTEAEAKVALKDELETFIKEVNEIFTTITTVKIRVLPRAILFSGEHTIPESKIYFGKVAVGSVLLREFGSWLSKGGYFAKYNYDVAALMTGFDVYHGSYATEGLARPNSTCNKYSSRLLLEMSGTYRTAFLLAHEIAHTLGASHDPPKGPCSGHVMTPTIHAGVTKRYEVSSCSSAAIKEFVDNLSPNCLLTTNPASENFVEPDAPPAGLLDMDGVCKRTLNSQMCPNTVPSCDYFLCRRPRDGACLGIETTDGTSCSGGTGTCNQRKCVQDSNLGKRSLDDIVPVN